VEENSEEKRATRNSWKDLKMFPSNKTELFLNRIFTEVEFQKISFGFIPKSMDDHWFSFLENNTLYFHRSWTGEAVYKVVFAKENDLYFSKEVRVSRFGWKHIFFSFATRKFHEKLLLNLIENNLLKENTPFPIPQVLKKCLNLFINNK
jgi:hypothetical protein